MPTRAPRRQADDCDLDRRDAACQTPSRIGPTDAQAITLALDALSAHQTRDPCST